MKNIADIYYYTVDFPRIVKQMYQQGVRLFIEVGARDHCTRCINKILEQETDFLSVAIDRYGKDSKTTVAEIKEKLAEYN